MEFLETVRNWLQEYARWQMGDLEVDYVKGQPNHAGLFPLGEEELERKTDILGNVTVRNRCSFLLRWNTTEPERRQEKAGWLMEFQDWIRKQNVEGRAPQIGSQSIWWAENARLREISQTGTVVYTVNLRVEYTREYKNGGML